MNSDSPPSRSLLRGILIFGAIWFFPVVLVVGLIFTRNNDVRDGPSPTRECRNDIRNVMQALINYELTEGHFPPAHPRLADGTPGYSWRVLLLPYFDQPALFGRFDFKSAWYIGSNREVGDDRFVRGMLQCPSDPRRQSSYWTRQAPPGDWTSYVAVTGPGTAFPDEGTTRLSDIKDDRSSTILVIEWPNSDIHWPEPRDVTRDEAVTWFRKAHADPSLMPHYHGIHVGFANGTVATISPTVAPEAFDAMLTIAGGERIDVSDFIDLNR
jgi:hypothetical protein